MLVTNNFDAGTCRVHCQADAIGGLLVLLWHNSLASVQLHKLSTQQSNPVSTNLEILPPVDDLEPTQIVELAFDPRPTPNETFAVAVGLESGAVWVVDLDGENGPKLRRMVTRRMADVTQIAWHRCDRDVIAVLFDDNVIVVNDGESKIDFTPSVESVTSFSISGSIIAMASVNSCGLSLERLTDRHQLFQSDVFNKSHYSSKCQMKPSCHPKSQVVAFPGVRQIRFLSDLSIETRVPITIHDSSTHLLEFDAQGDWLVSIDISGTIVVWNWLLLLPIKKIPLGTSICSLSLTHHDNDRLVVVCSSADGNIFCEFVDLNSTPIVVDSQPELPSPPSSRRLRTKVPDTSPTSDRPSSSGNGHSSDDDEASSPKIDDTNSLPTSPTVRSVDNGQVARLLKKIEQLEAIVLDSTEVGALHPVLQIGSTCRTKPDGTFQQFLCFNRNGYVFLEASQNPPTDVEELAAWRVETRIEVDSSDAGKGQRHRVFQNAKGFHLAAIGLTGFVLGHRGYAYLVSDVHPEGIWKSSMIEFTPFASNGPISKAGWVREFPVLEIIELLGITTNDVVVIARTRIWIFAHSGSLHHLSQLDGPPVCLTCLSSLVFFVCCDYGTRLLQKAPRKLNCFYWDVATDSNLVIANVLLSIESDESIVWAGISNFGVPIVVLKSHATFGLLPLLFRGKFGTDDVTQLWRSGEFPKSIGGAANFCFRWTSLLEPEDVRSVEKPIWPVYADCAKLHFYREGPQFPGTVESQIVAFPFRFPLALTDPAGSSVRFSRWSKCLKPDSLVSQLKDDVTIDWEVSDSMRLMIVMITRQIAVGAEVPGIARLILEAEVSFDLLGEECAKLIGTVSSEADKLGFRAFARLVTSQRLAAAFDVCRGFSSARAFKLAHDYATSKSQGEIAERIWEEVLRRRDRSMSQTIETTTEVVPPVSSTLSVPTDLPPPCQPKLRAPTGFTKKRKIEDFVGNL